MHKPSLSLFFTAVFFWASTKELLVSCFPRVRGAYPSFRLAKTSEVPGAHKSHWLFVTLPYQLQTPSLSCQEVLPKDVNITQLPCTSSFPPVLVSVSQTIGWIWPTPFDSLSLLVLSRSFIYVPLTRRGCRTDLTGQPTARRCVLFLESNIHGFLSLSLPFHLSRSFLWSVAGVPLLKKITMT